MRWAGEQQAGEQAGCDNSSAPQVGQQVQGVVEGAWADGSFLVAMQVGVHSLRGVCFAKLELSSRGLLSSHMLSRQKHVQRAAQKRKSCLPDQHKAAHVPGFARSAKSCACSRVCQISIRLRLFQGLF